MFCSRNCWADKTIGRGGYHGTATALHFSAIVSEHVRHILSRHWIYLRLVLKICWNELQTYWCLENLVWWPFNRLRWLPEKIFWSLCHSPAFQNSARLWSIFSRHVAFLWNEKTTCRSALRLKRRPERLFQNISAIPAALQKKTKFPLQSVSCGQTSQNCLMLPVRIERKQLRWSSPPRAAELARLTWKTVF